MSGPAAELNTSTEEIAGLVERVTYFNEESGFAVLRVKVRGRRDQVTVLGPVPAISAGEWLTGRGWWVRDKEHGLQFKAQFLKSTPPTTSEGVERYLGGGFVKGVGPVLAKKLVGHFGAEVLKVIGETPADLEAVDGIGPKRREKIANAWQEGMQIQRDHGIPPQPWGQYRTSGPHLQDLRDSGHPDCAGEPVHLGEGDPWHRLCHGGPDCPKRRNFQGFTESGSGWDRPRTPGGNLRRA